MDHITSFNTEEELQEYFAKMREAEIQALSRLHEQQRRITMADEMPEDGTRFWMSPRLGDYGVVIFGRAQSFSESNANEIQSGAEPEEAAYSDEALRDAFARGYVYGNAYSPLETRGELGSTHLSRVWPITEEQFNQAQECNFDFPSTVALARQDGEDWLTEGVLNLATHHATLR